MDVFAVGVVLFVLLVGRKPFNIADSESLSYCHMDLESCPGIQDSRSGHMMPSPAQRLVCAKPSQGSLLCPVTIDF